MLSLNLNPVWKLNLCSSFPYLGLNAGLKVCSVFCILRFYEVLTYGNIGRFYTRGRIIRPDG